MADVGIRTSGVGFRVYADAVEIPVTATGEVSWSGDSLVLDAFSGTYIDIFFDEPQDVTLTISGYSAATYNASDKASFDADPDDFASPWTQSSTTTFVTTTGSATPVQHIRFYTGNGGVNLTDLTMAIEVDVTEDAATVSYNCTCEDDYDSRTLAQMRTMLAINMGYASTVANLQAGTVLLLNQWLQMAQEMIYADPANKLFRMERFFRWEMQEDVRYYDLPDNADSCGRKLNPNKISWIGVENDGQWSPLVYGIKPEMYTNPDQTGLPSHVEIRQCIEVWPAPDSNDYILRIKGEFGLAPFTADTDVTTIDWMTILLRATALGKAHDGHADAGLYLEMERERIGRLVAGSHGVRRYIPGGQRPPNEAKPIFIP